jgi:hypothetical protein
MTQSGHFGIGQGETLKRRLSLNEQGRLGCGTTTHWPLAGIKDDNSDAHEFCASAKESANFHLVYDRDEPTPVVKSEGDPMMSFGHVAEVDAAMPKRHGVFIVLIGRFASEFDRVARSDLLVDIAAPIDSFRRFASKFCYPDWI